MANKTCRTYKGDNWNYPPGYSVTECEITFTHRELFEEALVIMIDEGIIPSTVTLSTEEDDVEVDFSDDHLTSDDIEQIEILLEEDNIDEEKIKSIIFGEASDKWLDAEQEI